jgi:hypothetical protein
MRRAISCGTSYSAPPGGNQALPASARHQRLKTNCGHSDFPGLFRLSLPEPDTLFGHHRTTLLSGTTRKLSMIHPNFQAAGGVSSLITVIIEEHLGPPAGLTSVLQGFHVRRARCGMCLAARSEAPRSSFLGHGCGGVRRCFWGRQEWGSGGNLEPGRDFPGPGGFRVSPQSVPNCSPPLVCAEWSRRDPDLVLLSC